MYFVTILAASTSVAKSEHAILAGLVGFETLAPFSGLNLGKCPRNCSRKSFHAKSTPRVSQVKQMNIEHLGFA